MNQDIDTSTAVVPVAALRAEWRELHGAAPPKGLGRDLLARGISWQRQAKEHGGLRASVSRQLTKLAQQLDRSGHLDIERQLSLKVGTRLVREWHGRDCHVLVLEQGFLFDDRQYASLSQIAREITGVKWSGPRFFGLRQRKRAGGSIDG